MGTCTNCQVEKDLAQFRKRQAKSNGRSSVCKDCHYAMEKSWAAANIDKMHVKNIRRYWPEKSDIEVLQEYSRMFEAQGGCCSICKLPSSIRLCVDHNHTTGKVRKLLCSGCNVALGRIKENFDTALNLAKYIQEDQGVI